MSLHSNFWQKKAGLGREDWVVEGQAIPLMALTSEMVEEVKEIENYNDALHYAADRGLMLDGKRIFDDEYLREDLADYWVHMQEEMNLDPCVRERVGERICQKSGLQEHLEDLLELMKEEEAEEEPENIIDGDGLTESQLAQDLGEFTSQPS
jgi:phage gp29-like protein